MLALSSSYCDLHAILSIITSYANSEHYVIHPDKSSIVPFHLKSKSEKSYLVKSTPFEINERPLPIVDELIHLGNRANNHVPESTVEDRLATGRRTLYGLMGTGFQGCVGLNVETSLHLLDTFVLPRVLYCLEISVLSKKALCDLELFHRKALRSLLGLPERTPNSALYILTGTIPLTYRIHIKTMKFLLSLLSVEHTRDIIMRQYVIKKDSSKSWVVYVQKLLQKYQLPSLCHVLENCPTKAEWKTKVHKAVLAQAERDIQEEASTKSTLNSLNTAFSYRNVHECLAMVENPNQVTRSNIKCRLLVDVYPIQTVMLRTRQTKSDICTLCNMKQAEDRVHFILVCPALQTVPTCADYKRLYLNWNIYVWQNMK